ncbi:MAG: type II toxin-antitoxin system PemK/MazF family toxin [Anaerolineales bacterium]|nr:type II toxin-antitoxin system PemK/MazF family toxin [Anaerolineales bacterium]
MLKPGDVVTVDFPGVTGVKRRPAVVVSTAEYHAYRPDVIVGVITSQVESATTPVDYLLQDWAEAGLRRPSAFRSFLATLPAIAVSAPIGQCSNRDWQAIQVCLAKAIATSS